MNAIADNVAMGAASDYASYQRMVGHIEGLAMAERYLRDFLTQISKANGFEDTNDD